MNLDNPQLTAYALGELGATERATMEALLAKSPELCRELEHIRQMAGWLADGLATEPCPKLTAAQREAVLHPSQAVSEKPANVAPLTTQPWFALTGWALAASFAAGFFIVLLNQRQTESAQREITPAMPFPTKSAQIPSEGIQPQAVIHKPTEVSLLLPATSSQSNQALSQMPDPPAATLAVTSQSLVLNPAVTTETVAATLPIGVAPLSVPNPMPAQPNLLAMAPLDLKLPIPAFMGTPADVAMTEYLEKPSDKPRPLVLAPIGIVNVAFKKSVTSSDKSPIAGSLDLVTDGDKESSDTSFVELHRKVQWVQIDLEAGYDLYVLVLWHAHNTPQVYHDVIVQVADDADFTQNVRTLYNNDFDNSAGLGIGGDKEYFESYEGRLIQANGVRARYVRAYSKGSTFSALNRYTEIEVYGLPSKGSTIVTPDKTPALPVLPRQNLLY